MTLQELFNHFPDKETWCDICTPLWRAVKIIDELQATLDNATLSRRVSNWKFTNGKLYVDL